MEKFLRLCYFSHLYGITGPGQMQYLLGEDVFCKPPVAQRTNPQQTPLMQKTLAFLGKNHHVTLAQNFQQPSACFLLRLPKGHRQLLP